MTDFYRCLFSSFDGCNEVKKHRLNEMYIIYFFLYVKFDKVHVSLSVNCGFAEKKLSACINPSYLSTSHFVWCYMHISGHVNGVPGDRSHRGVKEREEMKFFTKYEMPVQYFVNPFRLNVALINH